MKRFMLIALAAVAAGLCGVPARATGMERGPTPKILRGQAKAIADWLVAYDAQASQKGCAATADSGLGCNRWLRDAKPDSYETSFDVSADAVRLVAKRTVKTSSGEARRVETVLAQARPRAAEGELGLDRFGLAVKTDASGRRYVAFLGSPGGDRSAVPGR